MIIHSVLSPQESISNRVTVQRATNPSKPDYVQIPPKQAHRGPGKERGTQRGTLAHLGPRDLEPPHVGEHLHRDIHIRHAAVHLEMGELRLGV